MVTLLYTIVELHNKVIAVGEYDKEVHNVGLSNECISVRMWEHTTGFNVGVGDEVGIYDKELAVRVQDAGRMQDELL